MWGPCNGDVINLQPISLSDAGPCADNPCDPTCQNFDETPDGGLAPYLPSPLPWSVGDINALPDSIYQQGTNEPCTTGEECQFDQYCNNPARGACAHDPCAPGVPLLDTCNPCVEEICANDPTCCNAVYSGDCAHDPCVNGTSLKKDCDACTTAICNARPGCCTDQCDANADCPSGTCDLVTGKCTCGVVADCPAQSTGCSGGRCTSFWSGIGCANQVATICGGTCPPAGNWTAACAARVETDCAATCQSDPGCEHDKCYTGVRINGCADPCVTAICAVDPLCCSGAGSAWTSSCVDKVATVCNQVCPARGNCVSWPPAATNPLCAGVDVTVGVACGGTVPICNRGNTVAPAGIEIARFPAASGDFATCAPAGGTVACTTPTTIAQGECISVSGCTGLVDGVELMVNPPGGAAIAECHCENNWSIYQSATCQSPDCTGSSNVSLIKKVSMFVMFDRSLSMGGAALPNRWTPATKALKSFFQDPGSAGLGVALRFWPHDSPAPCSEGMCQPVGGGGCATPLVPLSTLTADVLPVDAQEQLLVDAVNATVPGGGTPMSPALDGAETWAINRKLANPDEEVVVVFVTDGIANFCDISNTGIRALAANAYQNFGVRTHAIGIANANATQVDQIAQAGGGASFFMAEGVTVEQNLLAAMLAIRGDAIPCDLSVPTSAAGPVTVELTNSMNMTTPLAEVANLAACGNGWYPHPTDPTLLKLCPATCTQVRNDPGAEILVSTPCALPVPLTHTQTYQGICPAGTQVQWGGFTYNTVTPGDSNVQFSVRTADTEVDLGAAAFTLAQTAQLTPDTQVCEKPGPPLCSIDLYTALGELPDATRGWLELQIVLNPASNGTSVPLVQSWEITYSCLDAP